MRFSLPISTLQEKLEKAKAKGLAVGDEGLTSAANFIVSVLLIRLVGFEGFGRFSVALSPGPTEIWAFAFYILTALISSVKIAASMFLELFEQPRFLAVANFLALFVSLASSFVLIRSSGVVGVPAASLITNATAFCLILFFSYKASSRVRAQGK